ncbi:MAG TPA: type I restriction endonuclease subunit R, partial [Chloroflexi bacterium]|nr:type I restriction endonuclease subunit R [Chloroflexota bacterium]
LVEGVDVSYKLTGDTKHDKIWLLDFDQPRRNDWLAVNQFTVTGVNPRSQARTHRRPDIVLFVNGLPLVIIELKNPADENATLRTAYNQLQTYKDDVAQLFSTNAALVVADGTDARMGTLTGGFEWFKPWRTVDGETLVPASLPELEVLIHGALKPAIFLDLVRYFTVFETDGTHIQAKKIALYHQYHAVNKAVQETIRASSPAGDQRVGVIWHTQGSGKSLSMLFYAGKIIQHPAMENPTLVVLTDRNDLDDQLFGVFAAGQDLLRQEPVQAESRLDLRRRLQVASGGVIFTTIQKFRPSGEDKSVYPTLSERHNIVFIADEAHRSQYGFEAHLVKRREKEEEEGYLAYGFAKYVRDALPNASFIGFTGTPIEATDVNTPQVFGDYIDVYDVYQAVDDQATVRIYYASRLAKLDLREDQRPHIDPDFDLITEEEELVGKEKLKTRWSRMEAMVGTEERLRQIARDVVTHFEQRFEILEGKGMIVAMSRRIAVDLYAQIVKLRPQWHSDRDDEGAIKVIMSGSAGDPAHYQPHIRSKRRRKDLAQRFKDPADPFKLVIVRDMWLTGFDAPPLHTMYVDKPMTGHGLMQAIARVNRVYPGKEGGLIVDYLGIATDLKEAMANYTRSGGRSLPAHDLGQAVKLMQTAYERVKAFFHDFDYGAFFAGSPGERVSVIPAAMEHILQQKDGKKRYMDSVARLSKSFALVMPEAPALAIRDEVAFFQAVRSSFAKHTSVDGHTREDMDTAIKQLVSQAVASDEVIDIFDAAGIQEPDVSILSDEFLDEIQRIEHKNLALELLRKLLNDEIKARARTNVVQARSFEQLLEDALRRYTNRTIDAAEVILEIIQLAKDLREAGKRGEDLGLSEEEAAFYDALADNESAVEVMGDESLAFIARELVREVRKNVTIDWTVRQSARARIRVLVKRILRRHGYPPDLQAQATATVLEQAELLATGWA